MTALNPPKTQDEFERVMERIDGDLQKAGVPIHGRSIHAVLAYTKMFQLTITMSKTGQKGKPGIFTGTSADAHIREWFDQRYGERQNVLHGPGTTVILLRGDPWELCLPLIYGEVNCVVERDLQRYPMSSTPGRLPTLNILTLINDFPPGLAARLTDDECRSVQRYFTESYESMSAIQYIKNKPYIPEALSDINAAIRHFFALPPHYGQSKWSSAQAAEKFLKSFLRVRNKPFPLNHDLVGLANRAESAGMATISPILIAKLKTSAGVRYGEEQVSLIDAVMAHKASLVIGKHVSKSLVP